MSFVPVLSPSFTSHSVDWAGNRSWPSLSPSFCVPFSLSPLSSSATSSTEALYKIILVQWCSLVLLSSLSLLFTHKSIISAINGSCRELLQVRERERVHLHQAEIDACESFTWKWEMRRQQDDEARNIKGLCDAHAPSTWILAALLLPPLCFLLSDWLSSFFLPFFLSSASPLPPLPSVTRWGEWGRECVKKKREERREKERVKRDRQSWRSHPSAQPILTHEEQKIKKFESVKTLTTWVKINNSVWIEHESPVKR